MAYTNKSMGSRVSTVIIPRNAYRQQKRRAGVYPNYYIETQVIPVTNGMTVYDDDTSSIGYDTGRHKFNYCAHTRRIPYPMNMKFLEYFGSYTVDQLPGYWVNSGMNWGELEDSLSFQHFAVNSIIQKPSMAAIDWSSLVSEVGEQLDGHMLVGQNLLVSLCQVAQTVRMLKDPFVLRRIVCKQGMPLSKAYRLPANAWLEYEFGWKNLFRDIEAVASVWEEVRQHQAHLEKTALSYSSLSARSSVSVANPFFTNGSLSFFDAGALILTPKLSEVRRTATFSLDVRRDAASTAWSKMDQVLHRLGVNELAEALWDLVPYSFVVDWFTHINRELGKKSIDWTSFDLRHIGYSEKWEWLGYLDISNSVSVSLYYKSRNFKTNPCPVQKEYRRYKGFPPNTTSVGFFGQLTKTQLIDGIALIVQRI